MTSNGIKVNNQPKLAGNDTTGLFSIVPVTGKDYTLTPVPKLIHDLLAGHETPCPALFI